MFLAAGISGARKKPGKWNERRRKRRRETSGGDLSDLLRVKCQWREEGGKEREELAGGQFEGDAGQRELQRETVQVFVSVPF